METRFLDLDEERDYKYTMRDASFSLDQAIGDPSLGATKTVSCLGDEAISGFGMVRNEDKDIIYVAPSCTPLPTKTNQQ